MNEYIFSSAEEDIGQRLDKWISEKDIGLTRSAVQNLILSGNVYVNQKIAVKNYKLRKGDSVKVVMPEPVSLDITAENIPLDIVYEDSSLLIVNKPKGMVVHPAPGNYSGTLVNALMHHCGNSLSGINGVIRPGSFMREYEAVAMGNFKETDGTIDAPIGRHHADRKKMCVTDKNSKNAVTHFHIIEQYEKCAYIRLRLETGRTHQIRVHLSYKGHPILGDDVYGKPYKGIEGQCLHARKIGFIHPESKEYMEFDSQLPDYFKEILRKVR